MTSAVNENARLAFRPQTRKGFPLDRYGPIVAKNKRPPTPLHEMYARSTALIQRMASIGTFIYCYFNGG